MKAKLLTILFFTVICAFFVGCGFSETEEIRDMYTSREGVLSSGRRFEFYGADSEADRVFTLEQLLEVNRLSYHHTYDFIIQEETIEEMLERPEMHFGVGHLDPDDVVIIADYFLESNDVLFYVNPLSVLVVNLDSGAVSSYRRL